MKEHGRIYDAVKKRLQDLGIDTSTLKIVCFGGGSIHDIVLDDRVAGYYERNSKTLEMYEEK